MRKEELTIEIENKEIDLQMIDAYEHVSFRGARRFNCTKKIYRSRIISSIVWAPRAALMSAYSYFSNDYYSDTIYELERFLKTYPVIHEQIMHIIYTVTYNSIVDESNLNLF